MTVLDIPGRAFAGLAAKEIVDGIDAQQRELLKQFFGHSLAGALAASCNFRAPAGLTRETLERYHEIARQMIQKGQDQSCVQSVRFSLVERALSEPASR